VVPPSAGVARSAQPLAAGERRSPVPRGEIEIHDQRGRDSPTAWIRAIGERLELFDRGAVPFAVLLVEIRELDSLCRSEDPDELARLAEEVEGVLASELRASAPDGGLSSADSREEMLRGSLTRQRPGRYWLLVGASDRPRAEELAGRLRRAVAARVSYRREPLDVVIGTAACPEDGRRSSALAAHADVGLYAARSDARAESARRLAPVDESVQ
jgi:GGDEF domain-containing protein